MKRFFSVRLGVTALLAAGAAAPAAAANAWDDAQQMIVITSADWPAKTGQLQRYARAAAGQAWQAEGTAIPVALGKTGMGWGRGLHAAAAAEPQKREGDGKSPAGVFRLTAGFGYADARDAAVNKLKLPYLAATPALQCVDDPKSASYNRIVDRTQVSSPDWTSFEEMRRKDALYRWGVVIEHNGDRTPGAGSCVFMHVWRAANQPTVGCSVMAESAMHEVLAWLDPRLKPVLVQLPRAAYAERRAEWGLP